MNLIKSLSEQKEKEDIPFPFSFITIGDNNIATRELREQWLSLFRLLLALVQHEPSILCQCMNHNLDRIVNCNRMLHTATEGALWFILKFVLKLYFSDGLWPELPRVTR